MFTFRRARWFVVASGIGALCACSDHRLGMPTPQVDVSHTDLWVQEPELKLDILFMVDNSGSMADKQDNLVRNFPRFMGVLEGAVAPGSTLDAHVAVVSSDLGVGTPGMESLGCGNTGGDNGVFQSSPRGACTGPRGSYIITNAAGQNFDGTVADVFSCIARLGTSGCGFEHQLAAVRRALGGDPTVGAPAANVGFLRPDARLGIVLITDEDDCSAPSGSDLFTDDPAMAAAYGPLDSYRCNEFGHLCAGAPPPRSAVSGLTCQSNESGTGRLIHVGEFVDFFRKLKADPDLLRVAAITGPATPYATHIAQTSQGAITRISPSCTGPTGAGDAAPAVRLRDFVEAFGDRGLLETICTDDFGPAMEHIARTLVPNPVPCVNWRLYDRDATQAGIQADCTVTETHYREDGTSIDQAIPACAAGGAAPTCWRVAANPVCTASPDGVAIAVDRGPDRAASNTRTRWACRICATGDVSPACGR
jgi:hypothetical protein